MKRHVLIRLATAISVCAVAPSAHAHHSYGMFYDLCTSVTIEGQVVSVAWRNPHVMIDLTTGEGTEYLAEWTGPQNLTAARVTPDVLKAGDRIVVTGSPVRDEALTRAAYPALARDPALKIVSALTQIRRATDGWNWTRTAGPPPPECGRP